MSESKITSRKDLIQLANPLTLPQLLWIVPLSDCFLEVCIFHGDLALQHNTTSTRNQPKINPAKIDTAGSTRQ